MQVAEQTAGLELQKGQFCTFWLSGRHFGVDILDVKEVNPEVNYTPIFHAPKEVLGYISIRGELYLLLDLRSILGFEGKGVDESSRVVLFRPEAGEAFGVLVDRLGDTVTVDPEQIENRRTENQGLSEGLDRRSIDISDGVCKLEDGLLVIVNSRKLLNIIGDLRA